jgi:hypothetical protein
MISRDKGTLVDPIGWRGRSPIVRPRQSLRGVQAGKLWWPEPSLRCRSQGRRAPRTEQG